MKIRQQGATLLVVMIFLILMSLFAVSTFTTSTGNLRVVGNMQTKQEGIAAAQQAIEFVLSSELFTTDPELVSQSPVDVDINGDGSVDYVVRMTPKPSCYRVTPVPDCGESAPSSGGASGTLLEGISGGGAASTCFTREWNVRAIVTDPRSGMTVAVNQGVAVPSSDSTCL
ncbi:MAG TPA: pilus assembly PilX N-terminal domain-containing protein [Burkholderiaceae bacterium]|nr:pilus assembly PilX N-terminal domain-containing protein [Burkholderiaceae bacterium]